MVQKLPQLMLFGAGVEASEPVCGGAVTPNTNVAEVEDRARMMRKVTLKLTNFVVSILAANDYGGTKLCDLPDSNLLFMGAEANLSLVKGGITNGLEAAVDVNVAVGSAVASAIDLTATAAENNILESSAITDDLLTVALQKHSHGQVADGAMPVQVADSPTAALYLNASVTVGITANDTLTVSGEIDLYFFDLGNRTS